LISNTFDLNVRVVFEEGEKFSLTVKRQANDNLMALAEELSELLTENKYKFSFFYQGKEIKNSERFGDY